MVERRCIISVLIFFILIGCRHVTPIPDEAPYGKDGWRLVTNYENYKVLRRSGQTVEIKHDPRYPEIFWLKYTPTDITFPMYPDVKFVEQSSRVLWEYRSYRIPDGKKFKDVWDWYYKHFDFKQPSSK